MILLALLCGCTRATDAPAADVAKTEPAPEVDRAVTLESLYAVVVDGSMPGGEKAKLFAMMNKAFVEWDCLLGDKVGPAEFLVCPKRDAIGGIRLVPPPGMIPVLAKLPRFTPLRVRGRLVSGFNGLHLEATSVEPGKTTGPGHSPEPAAGASH